MRAWVVILLCALFLAGCAAFVEAIKPGADITKWLAVVITSVVVCVVTVWGFVAKLRKARREHVDNRTADEEAKTTKIKEEIERKRNESNAVSHLAEQERLLKELLDRMGMTGGDSLFDRFDKQDARFDLQDEVLANMASTMGGFLIQSETGFLRTNPHGKCIEVNPAWTRMTGLSLEEARGDGWLSAVHPEDRAALEREWDSAHADGRQFRHVHRYQRRDGVTTRVRMLAQPTKNSAGTYSGYVVFSQEITA